MRRCSGKCNTHKNVDDYYKKTYESGNVWIDRVCKECRLVVVRERQGFKRREQRDVIMVHDPLGLSVIGAEFSGDAFRYDLGYKNYPPGTQVRVLKEGIFEIGDDYKLHPIAR